MSRDAFAVPGPRGPVCGPAGRGADELLLAQPLIRCTLGRGTAVPCSELPVPMLSASRRSLWRLARAVTAVEEAAATGRPSGQDLAWVGARCRDALEGGLYGLDEPGLRMVTIVLVSRFACLTKDQELGREVAEALHMAVDEMLVLPGGLVVGPVGWFAAEVDRLLGRGPEARRANAAALRLSREWSEPSWVARCRLQRSRFVAPAPVAAPRSPSGHPAGTTSSAAPAASSASEEVLGLLPPRQLKVLALAAKGLTNAEIAAQLFLSVATVERHFTSLYRSLGVRNRAGALGRFAELTAGGVVLP